MTIRFNYNIRLAGVETTWFTIMHDWLKAHPCTHLFQLPDLAGLGVELEDNRHQFAGLLDLGGEERESSGHFLPYGHGHASANHDWAIIRIRRREIRMRAH